MSSHLHGFLFVVLGVAFALTPAFATPAQSDVTALVSAARQALGGEAALTAVSTLGISGSFSRRIGPGTTQESFESTWVAPDQFLRVSRRRIDSPIASYEITSFDGFDGDRAIHDLVAPNAPAPVTIPGPPPATPEEAAARKATLLDGKRQVFFASVIPLLISMPPSYGLTVTSAGKERIPGGQADVIDLKRADGKVWRLLVDDRTHLPYQLMWMAKPVVTMTRSYTTTSPVIVGPRGVMSASSLPDPPPMTFPGADPTASLPFVVWTMTIRDYKTADGYTWPRRFTTSYDGKDYEDKRVSRYRINLKVDAAIFKRAVK